jgi:multidrug resistance efflux pump
VLAVLDQPDLSMKLAQKRAQIAQSSAKIRLARSGPRLPSNAVDSAAEPDIRAAEMDAERAQLEGLKEEAKYLETVQSKLTIRAAAPGVVATADLRERIGNFCHEGDLLMVIEDLGNLQAQLLLPEQEVQHVAPGQTVEIRARAQPFRTFHGKVTRVAPVAALPTANPWRLSSGDDHSDRSPPPNQLPPSQNLVAVYCSIDDDLGAATNSNLLLPGMTGHARVDCGRAPIGKIAFEKVLRVLRTEFW